MATENSLQKKIIDVGRQAVLIETRAVADVAPHLDESFAQCALMILEGKGKVIPVGSGTSSMIARRLAHLLSVSGTPALFVHSMDALHGSMGGIGTEDIVIAFSKGGGSAELNELCQVLSDRGTRIVAVTENPQSQFAKIADLVCVLSSPEGADPGNMIAMGSTLASGAWGDALARVLMELRGHDWAKTLQMHPAGAVGQRTELPEQTRSLLGEGEDTRDGHAH